MSKKYLKYDDWKAEGRHVKRGEKAVWIKDEPFFEKSQTEETQVRQFYEPTHRGKPYTPSRSRSRSSSAYGRSTTEYEYEGSPDSYGFAYY